MVCTSDAKNNRLEPMKNISELGCKKWKVHIDHINKEVNKGVDFLAKMSINKEPRLHILEQPPNELEHIILSYTQGTRSNSGSENRTKNFLLHSIKPLCSPS